MRNTYQVVRASQRYFGAFPLFPSPIILNSFLEVSKNNNISWSKNARIGCYRMIMLKNPCNPCQNPLSASQLNHIFILGGELG